MTEPNKLFYDNTDYLQELGTVSSSSGDGSRLEIGPLTAEQGTVLLRGLVEYLEVKKNAEYSGDKFDFMVSSDLGSVIEQRKRERTTLLKRLPDNHNYEVKLEQDKQKRISLVAQVRERVGEISDPGKNINLQAGYIAVLNEITIIPSPPDKLEESVENVLSQIEVEVKGSSSTRIDVMNHKESDIQEAPKILRLLGVKDADNIKLLEKLWIDRSLDKIALIDLWVHLVEEKQALIGSNSPEYYPDITLQDMVQTGLHIPAADLRGLQQKRSERHFVGLGYEDKDIERRVLNADKDRALRYRYASWLIEQPFMCNFKRKIKADLAKDTKITTNQLFLDLTTGLIKVYKTHKENEDKKYSLDIDWQREEYSKKLEFLRTCTWLSMDIFWDKDVSEAIKGR